MVDQISKHELGILLLKSKLRSNARLEILYTGYGDVYNMEDVGHVKICSITEKELIDYFMTLPVMDSKEGARAIHKVVESVTLRHEKIQKALIKLTEEEIEALGISHLVQP